MNAAGVFIFIYFFFFFHSGGISPFRKWISNTCFPCLLSLSAHISSSALYVVDLKKFRKIAAGDRLRGQYQALSQDPNSLSNLDQVYNSGIVLLDYVLQSLLFQDLIRFVIFVGPS